ncbi:MAG: YlqD family protein [Armatimonadetes bacterium]|nr:YlqD family protein [Armatimonadota bacterium]
MGVILKRQVLWRAVVTPQLKQEIAEELQAAADEIDQRVEQLEFSTKAYLTNLQRADLAQALELRRQIEAEKKRQQSARDEILKQKEQVAQLEDGAEIIRGVLEGFVEVDVGDDLPRALAGYEIVTKDGKVIEIREVQELGRRPLPAASKRDLGGQKDTGGLIITES